MPSDNHDRYLVVRLTAEKVIVDYRLELDETRAARDLPAEEIKKITDAKQFYRGFIDFFAPVLANNLVATLDGDHDQTLEFHCVRRSYQVLDHLRCDFRFEAHWSPAPGREHVFRFREGNYEAEDFNRLYVSLAVDSSIHLSTTNEPDGELLARPAADRKPGDGERLRKVAATFKSEAVQPKGAYKPSLPPDLDAPRDPPAADANELAALNKGGTAAPAAVDKPGGPPTEADADETPAARSSLLHLLLNSREGFWGLLFIAAFLGAAHALMPGHGKTLVAAYLIGERGTVWHALLLGLVTTITHTWSVIVLGAVMPYLFDPKTVERTLGLVGGLLIVGLGAWMFFRRLSGRADHFHLGGHAHGHSHGHGHHHHHEADHVHDEKGNVVPKRVGLWGLVVLGISGGIIPCWDAIAMLSFAVSAGRLTLALPLLLAFSAGLASVLIAVGVGVVYAGNFVAARWGESSRGGIQKMIRALPGLSAIVITVLGLWLCFESTSP